MDVQPAVDRLKERLKDLNLREIAAAAGLNAAMSGNRSAPAVYLIPLAETAKALEDTGPVEQIERRLFGVVMVLETRDFNSSTGMGVSLETLRQRIKKALIGWVPDEVTGECVTFQGGELVDFPGNGSLWWADEYVIKGYFRSEE